MTASQPDALPAVSDEMIPGADTEGCVCVVASYVTAASLVSAAAEDAGRRIMMTPALGDFVELSFVSMGPEPRQSGYRSAAVKLITENVLASDSEAGRTYFAIVVAEPSAAEAERVMAECATSPFLASLPMRLHGIAMREDRRDARDLVCGGQIAVAAPGAWGQEYLVGELRRYADELMRYFAADQQGLSRDELGSLKARYEEHVEREHVTEAMTPPVEVAPEAPARKPSTAASQSPAPPADLPFPDSSPSAAQPDILAAASPQRPALPQPEPAVPPLAEAPSSPAADAPPDLAGPRDNKSAPARPRLRRLLDARWHRAKPAVPIVADQAAAATVSGLAYLLIVGESIADDPEAWQRSRAALLAVDQKIAALRQAAYTVRLLEGDEEALWGEARPAGQLSKRNVRSPVPDADFAGVLNEIRKLMRRDTARYAGSGRLTARPTVVFFASEPPLADSVTAEVFGEFTQEASVMWVIPKGARDLMAPTFTEHDDSFLVEDGDGAADDIVDLLVATATAVPSHE